MKVVKLSLKELKALSEVLNCKMKTKYGVYKMENSKMTSKINVVEELNILNISDAKTIQFDSKEEMMSFIEERFDLYKTDKEMYMDFNKMDEETWKEWNKGM